MTQPDHLPDTAPGRIASICAVLFAITLFMTVASVNVPYDVGDAEHLAWWQERAHVTSGMISMFFAIATALLFAVVGNDLLARFGDRAGPLAAFARVMATAFTVSMLMVGALRGVVGHLVQVQNEPLPGLDVLRFSTALNYTVLGVVAMGSFAIFALTAGALVLRTAVLARWVGFVSIGCGVVTLGAVVALVGAFTVPVAILWALSTAVATWRASRVDAHETHPAPAMKTPIGAD
jgi:hypothetical protein